MQISENGQQQTSGAEDVRRRFQTLNCGALGRPLKRASILTRRLQLARQTGRTSAHIFHHMSRAEEVQFFSRTGALLAHFFAHPSSLTIPIHSRNVPLLYLMLIKRSITLPRILLLS